MVSTMTGMLGPFGTRGVRHDRIVSTPERLCPMCRRVQRLSGEERCAIHVKATTLAAHHKEFDTKQISGSSPPGVFVGRFGYPKVFVGPLVPPVHGDTRILDAPEEWVGHSMEDIVRFRSTLVRGMHRVHVRDVDRAGRIVDLTR